MKNLSFKYATMNAGKSLDLIITAYNYRENGYHVLVLKPLIDTKAGSYIESRIGLKLKVDMLIDASTNIIASIKDFNNIDCILVDEAQFLSRKQIDELYLITKKYDIPVLCYGLRLNFKMESFEGSLRLLEIAEELEEIKTLCSCGEIARYVGRKVDGKFVSDGLEVLIDKPNSKVKYVPMCGKCYLQKVKHIDLKTPIK